MSKKIKTMMSILILVVILAMQISYAVSNKETAKTSFMKLSKDEISIGETLEITFDLSSIKDYDNFTIKLSSNVTLNNAYFDEKSNLKLSANKDDVSIDINKSELNLDKITLYYDVQKTVSVGDVIEFTVNVTTAQNNQEQEEKKEKDSKTTENTTTEIKVLDETKKVTIVESVEEKSTETEETAENENSKQTKNNDTDEKTANNQKPSEEKSSSKETSSSKTSASGTKSSSGSGSSSSSGSTQTVTYKGSNNNYLSNIELEGATLNTSFNKENTTYFATVKNVSSLNIIATAEDSTASVNYTGNDNIQIGENKILISVTAQNGNVRYYRIYITCEEE